MLTFTLKLGQYTLRKLSEAARKAGVAPERIAAKALEAWLLPGARLDRGPAGVEEPAHSWTAATRDVAADHLTPENYEGPFLDLDVALHALGAARITALAKRIGITPEKLATLRLDSRLFDYDDFQWPEGGDPRAENAGNYDLNEVGRPWSEVRPEMEALLERRLAERK